MKNRFTIAAPLLALASASSAFGQTNQTWDNGSTDFLWNTSSSNWSAAAWTNGNNAIFDTTGSGTLNVNGVVTVKDITFNANGYSIGDADNDGTLTLNSGGSINVGTGISASISETLAGTNDINKKGSGTLILSADNSAFRGIRNVESGTLRLLHNSAMGGTGIHSDVSNGATLEVDGGLTGITRTIYLQGSGVGGTGALHSLTGSNVFTGQVNLAGSASINVDSGSSLTLNQAITVFGGPGFVLTKIGDGSLVLKGVSTYTGGTTVNAGTLVLSGGSGGNARIRGALTVNSGATVNFASDDGTGLGWNGDVRVTTLTIAGGTVSSSTNDVHVWNMTGGVNMTGGTLQTNNGVSSATGPQFQWNRTNVTTNASANTATIAGRINMRSDSGSTGITFTVADGAAATDLLVSAAITQSSSQAIVKNGAGTMTLSGTSTYTGTTTVSVGTLLVNGSLGDTAVTVASGAFLGGSGTVGTSAVLNTLTVNGTLAPGNSPGILTVNDNLDLNGTLSMELEGTTAGSGYDRLVVNGTVDITGSSLSALFDTFTPVNGDLLFILLNDGTDAITGTFSGFAQNATVINYGGLDWKISYNADFTANTFTGTANGNDIALMAIPEPSAALLGGLGMLCLLRRRRA